LGLSTLAEAGLGEEHCPVTVTDSDFASDEHWQITTYPAWSDQEHRWVDMTFLRYQSWLARPDLDPAEFASDHGVS